MYSDCGSDSGWDDSEYKPPACEALQSESGESELAADVEEEELGAPNNTKVSQKGKTKLNRKDIQAARRTNTTVTTAELETAKSDGKRKATNKYVLLLFNFTVW